MEKARGHQGSNAEKNEKKKVVERSLVGSRLFGVLAQFGSSQKDKNPRREQRDTLGGSREAAGSGEGHVCFPVSKHWLADVIGDGGGLQRGTGARGQVASPAHSEEELRVNGRAPPGHSPRGRSFEVGSTVWARAGFSELRPSRARDRSIVWSTFRPNATLTQLLSHPGGRHVMIEWLGVTGFSFQPSGPGWITARECGVNLFHLR